MNRLELLPPPTVADPSSSPGPPPPVCRRPAEESSVAHALFAPEKYEPRYAYPLVVWLHGPGESELQLRRVMPDLSMQNCVAIAPRGTLPADEETGEGGYDWRQSEDHILLAEQRVQRGVELARQRFHVHRERIFLAGYGRGGTMALRLALGHPRKFAGAASVEGAFPRRLSPLRRINEVRDLPLLLTVGGGNSAFTPERLSHDLRLFHTAGMNVSLRHYPDSGPYLDQMLGDLNRWMMEVICPGSTAVSEARGEVGGGGSDE